MASWKARGSKWSTPKGSVDNRYRDIDPEDLNTYHSQSDGSADTTDASGAEDGARNHYADVGKSALRKRDVESLGPQYKGSKVSRDTAFGDDSDDPFGRDYDEKEDTEDDGEDMGSFTQVNGRGAPFDELDPSESSDGGVDGNEVDDDDDDGDFDNTSGEEELGVSDDRAHSGLTSGEEVDRAELRRIMAEEQKHVTAIMSQAMKADLAKGNAVKLQRKAFDSSLHVRIRLQKTLVAMNSLSHGKETTDFETASDAASAAEAAAMKLWNSLNDLRSGLQETRTGTKRKRVEEPTDASSNLLWSQMRSLQTGERAHHHAVINRWSTKARGAASVLNASRGRLDTSVKEQTLTDVLASQLLDHDRLVKRTRTPRSCAPLQANAGMTESADIYDDADFYGLLLKELLEQRNSDAVTAALDFNVTAPWQAAREAKTKKLVDTKASKGRKLRYTIHEKLQNFMAPEDRTTWGVRQVDDLFGSLFGRTVKLGEDADEPVSDDEAEKEEAGLVLFRS